MRRFFAALDVLPGWIWALLCAGAISSAALSAYRLQAERLAHQTTHTQHAAALAAAHAQRATQEAQYRKTEQELINAQAAHATETKALHVDLDRARARLESFRVRDAAKAAAERARKGCAATTAADVREATGDPIGVLADVLGRADERAAVLADLADRRGIAGRACEREYDAAREALRAAP